MTNSQTSKVHPVFPHGILSFNRESIEKVLAGDRTKVSPMFVWTETPKALSSTWQKCHDSYHLSYPTHTGIALNEEQKAFLRWLLKPEIIDQGGE